MPLGRYAGGVLRTKTWRSSSLRLLDDRDRDEVARAVRPRPGRQRVRQLPGPRGRAGPGPARRPDLGLPAGGRLTSLCYAGANLVPVAATPPRSLPSPGAPGCWAAAARRSWGRRRTSLGLWELLRPYWGRPREIRASAAGDGHLRPAAGGARPAGAPGPARRARHPAARLGGHVHRGGRRLAAGPRRRRRLPGPGARADRRWAAPSPGSRTAGWCSRRRSARSPRTPARCRASGSARSARPRAGRGRDGRGGHRGAAQRRAGGVAVRQRLQRARPGPPTGGWASPRPPPSPPSCSEPTRPGGP